MSETATGVDRSKLKVGICAGLFGASALWLGYAIAAAVGGTATMTMPIVAALPFFVFAVLAAAFIKGPMVYGEVLFGATLLVVAPLYKSFSTALFFGALLAYGMLLAGGRRGQTEAANRLRISIGRITRETLPLAISGIALLGTVLYAQPLLGHELRVSEHTIQSVVAPSEFILKRFVSGFSLSMSVGSFVDAIGNSGAIPGLGSLPAAQRNELLAQSRGPLLAQLSDMLGVAVRERETVEQVFAAALDKLVRGIPREWGNFIVIALAFTVFLTLKGIGFLLVYPIQFFVWVIYELLLATGFARVVLEQKSKETIVL